MAKIYQVEIEELLQRIVKVRANSLDEAIQKVGSSVNYLMKLLPNLLIM